MRKIIILLNIIILVNFTANCQTKKLNTKEVVKTEFGNILDSLEVNGSILIYDVKNKIYYFSGSAQDSKDFISKENGRTVRTYKLEDPQYLQQYLRENWKLTAVEIDTIWSEIKKEAPETKVMVTRIKSDNNNFFQSGDFKGIQNDFKNKLDSLIDYFNQEDVLLTRIDIVSSTDRQQCHQI